MKKGFSIKIITSLPFCKFVGGEVGIADGKLAGEAWREARTITSADTDEFGWYDSEGNYFINDKHQFSRPDANEIEDALRTSQPLLKLALEQQLIETTEK
jgi:hypothetical protein